jgi:hypothetical protein
MIVICIPWDATIPCRIAEVGDGWQDLAAAIGGGCHYIERVKVQDLYPLVLVVDEEGLYGQQHNARASKLYPGPTGIKGNVLVVAEGWRDGGLDFLSLVNPEGSLAIVERAVS